LKAQFYEPDVGYENLWVLPSGAADTYVVESIPFFVYNISLKDVVRAMVDDKRNDVVTFERLVEKSGHKTIRVRPDHFTLSDENGADLLKTIELIGCEFEILPPRLVAIDVPDEQKKGQIVTFLTKAALPWEYADPSGA
jgi:hypothetical protein